tara:strand:+ start:2770 stop:3096 length:327 start_codon:yes stop_codon:yes gene_type:complete
MQTGQLRTPVVIQKPTVLRDSTGKASYTFTDTRTVFAAVLQNSSDQLEESQGTVTQDRYTLRMRWMPDLKIDTTYRLLYDGRQWQITGTEDVKMRHRELLLDVEEAGT